MVLETSRLRFLIVDDELHIRKIIKAVCAAMGVGDIIEAADGRSALEWLTSGKIIRKLEGNNRRFDLVICDWMMPEMTGIELLRSVRKNKSLTNIPFLMLTAENDRTKVLSAIEEGVSDYVVKPFTADVLEQKIMKIFKQAS